MPQYGMFLERLGQIEWKFNVAAGMAVVILLFVLENYLAEKVSAPE